MPVLIDVDSKTHPARRKRKETTAPDKRCEPKGKARSINTTLLSDSQTYPSSFKEGRELESG
ncbi:MAG: hypothetical protein E6Q97_33645 [Desulfurellales bacterium]|nr:MAG: hypothetical protein E6Q97_33645 [Desulfurellales bacterium]